MLVVENQLQNARFGDFLNRFRKREHDQDKFGDSATRCVTKDSGVNRLVRCIECLFIVYFVYTCVANHSSVSSVDEMKSETEY